MQLAGGANGRRKILSTFVAVGCLLAVSVVVAYVIGMRASELNRDLSRESEVIRELERFVSSLKDIETGQRWVWNLKLAGAACSGWNCRGLIREISFAIVGRGGR